HVMLCLQAAEFHFELVNLIGDIVEVILNGLPIDLGDDLVPFHHRSGGCDVDQQQVASSIGSEHHWRGDAGELLGGDGSGKADGSFESATNYTRRPIAGAGRLSGGTPRSESPHTRG